MYDRDKLQTAVAAVFALSFPVSPSSWEKERRDEAAPPGLAGPEPLRTSPGHFLLRVSVPGRGGVSRLCPLSEVRRRTGHR